MDRIDRAAQGFKAFVLLFALTLIAGAPGVFNIPALDRDESRFAQASKQMVETGDYILIRYQDRLRNKKPAGIHWLQAGSVAALSEPGAGEIWPYRVPSWIGVSLATVTAFWAGLVLIGRPAAFLGALLFGATLLLTSEAHISKTDGVLVFLTTLGMAALARLYIRQDNDRRMALLFWLAMGLGFLIKGPVTPLVAGLAMVGLYLWDGRQAGWMRSLGWWPGPALFVLLVLPWFAWVQIASSGDYLEGAVGKDLRDKLVSASEGHGGPPGYHLLHMPALLFPATLFLIPAIYFTWQGVRRTALDVVAGVHKPGLKFLLAWAVPTWLFFEFLPTKLSHYILPAYPALGLLCGYGAYRLLSGMRAPALQIASAGLFALGGAVLLAVFSPWVLPMFQADILGEFKAADPQAVAAQWANGPDQPLWLWGLGAATLVAATVAMGVRRLVPALALAIVSALAIGWHARIVTLPGQTWLHPTEQAREALIGACALPKPHPAPEGCGPQPDHVQAVGYSEPSYVFRLGTANLHPPETVVALPASAEGYPAGFVINLEDPAGPTALETLQEAARETGRCLTRSAPRYALNYSNGDPVTFVGVRIDDAPCGEALAARADAASATGAGVSLGRGPR